MKLIVSSQLQIVFTENIFTLVLFFLYKMEHKLFGDGTNSYVMKKQKGCNTIIYIVCPKRPAYEFELQAHTKAVYETALRLIERWFIYL